MYIDTWDVFKDAHFIMWLDSVSLVDLVEIFLVHGVHGIRMHG